MGGESAPERGVRYPVAPRASCVVANASSSVSSSNHDPSRRPKALKGSILSATSPRRATRASRPARAMRRANIPSTRVARYEPRIARAALARVARARGSVARAPRRRRKRAARRARDDGDARARGGSRRDCFCASRARARARERARATTYRDEKCRRLRWTRFRNASPIIDGRAKRLARETRERRGASTRRTIDRERVREKYEG